uniref:Cytochrome P450 n=1 Tax=Homalodisca liturata TaxID=320908 RepID=A0A1B6HA25_9HEMI
MMVIDFVKNFVYSHIFMGVVFVVYGIYRYFTGNRDYWRNRNVSYIQNEYLTEYFTGKQSETILQIYRKLTTEKYGGLFFFNKPVLIVRDPELVDSILVTNFSYFQNRELPEITHEPLAGNLFSLRGKEWRDQRYKLLTTFTPDKLERMFGQISSCGDNMMDKLEDIPVQSNGGQWQSVVFDYVLDVISNCAFGMQFPSFRLNMFKAIVQHVFSTSPLQILRFAIIIFLPKLAWFVNLRLFPSEICDYFINLTKVNLKFRRDSKIRRDDYFQQLVDLLDKDETVEIKCAVLSDNTTDDVIVNQMQFTEDTTTKFTEDTVCANSFSFLASAKAVSSTISHILLELSRHPDSQERLHQEVISVLAKHGSWSYQALQEMTYLDQVIQEVQRMYPLFPTLMRECTRPYKIPDSNLTIEKGVLVLIPVVALHRDPNYYPDPDLFMPERFEGNNYKPSSTYLPFGNGPRICIAMRFAILQLKTCVAKIISQYNVKFSNKSKMPPRFAFASMTPLKKSEILLVFEKRNSNEGEMNHSEHVLSQLL